MDATNGSYNGTNNEMANEKKDIKQYIRLKLKRRKIAADIKFIDECQKSNITPNFVKKYVKFDHNSKFQKALERKVLQIEKNKHYKTLSDLDLKTYHLHLKLANYLGSYIWENLEYNIFDMIAFHSRKKRRNLDKKFRNLKKQMPMS